MMFSVKLSQCKQQNVQDETSSHTTAHKIKYSVFKKASLIKGHFIKSA